MTTFSLERCWTIENVGFYRAEPRSFEPLKSPVFYAPEHDLQFTMLFYPNGRAWHYDHRSFSGRAADVHYTDASLLVSTISGGQREGGAAATRYWKRDALIGVEYTFTLMKPFLSFFGDSVVYSGKFKQSVSLPSTDHRTGVNGIGAGLEDPKGGISYYSNGNLELICRINVTYPTASFSGITSFPPPPPNSTQLVQSGDHLEQMKGLLKAGTKSDVTLVAAAAGGDQQRQVFRVHRLLLATHSAVFEAMFSHENTREDIERMVVIEDVSAQVLAHLLFFIYTGTVESQAALTTELLYAADKYQVNALKVACERHLSQQLTAESAFPLLLHADLHSAAMLRENCLRYLAFHSAEVMASTATAWRQFTTSALPELVCEVVSRVVAK